MPLPKRKSARSSAGSSSKNKRAKSGHDADDAAYDSDEPPPPIKSNDDKLLWRQDPDESFSDWTIEVSYDIKSGRGGNSVKKTDIYHIHKANLASGPRRSEYFVRLFKDGGRFAESSEKKSRIELNEIAAKVFPQLLDYVYSTDGTLEISTSSATALYHLGGYFEIRRLRWEAKQFWQKDMTSATCGMYYEHAKILFDDKIKAAAMELCAQSIMEVNESSRLLHVPDEEFWTNLLETRAQAETNTEAFSLHVSKLIAVYFKNCGASSAGAFKKLTVAKYIPTVHRDAAIKLMEAEREIVGNNNSNRLTPLQQRCINAITQDWANFDQIPQSDITLLQKQSPLLLTKALTAFAAAAKKGAREKVKEEQQKFIRIDGQGGSIRHAPHYGPSYMICHPQDPQRSAPAGSPIFPSGIYMRAVYYYSG